MTPKQQEELQQPTKAQIYQLGGDIIPYIKLGEAVLTALSLDRRWIKINASFAVMYYRQYQGMNSIHLTLAFGSVFTQELLIEPQLSGNK